MEKVKARKWRSTIKNTRDGMEVIIPTKKNFLRFSFLVTILGLWAFFGVNGLEDILNSARKPSTPAFLVILIIWSVFGALVIFILHWNVMGREVVRIDHRGLHHLKEYLFNSYSEKYDFSRIGRLRIFTEEPSSDEWAGILEVTPDEIMEFWGFTGGKVAFDYDGYKTYTFGVGLDEAEAEHIILKIEERFGEF